MKPVGPQFKEVKPVVGAFVLGALVIVISLLFATARAQRWFERVVAIQIQLPEEGSFGLRRGSSVEMLGSSVGSVDEIWIDDKTDRMEARLSIQSAFFRFVRVDSRYMIKRRTFGLAGDAYVEISRGTKAAAVPGQRFVSEMDRAPTELLQELSGELLPTIRAARDVIQNHGLLAQSLSDPEGSLLQALKRADRILDAIDRGEGVAGKVVRDPAWAARFDKLLDSLQATIDQLRGNAEQLVTVAKGLSGDASTVATKAGGVLDDTKLALQRVREILDRLAEASGALPDLAKVVREETKELGGMVLQSRNALFEVERLVIALQDHWLIRSYVPSIPMNTRIAPSELGGAGGRR